MKNIKLSRLILKNFKGIKDLSIPFNNLITFIFGENATGKTTIFDAFVWLLFDKDSQNRSDFEIKTLSETGEPLHGLDHEVIGELYINGSYIKLQKTYREVWTKKRGEAEKSFTGHETLYYIDDVPVKKSEYQEKINSIVDENVFKLITNPLFFSTNMKWQDRRKVLLDIIGDIDDMQVINYKSDLRALEKFLGDKDIDTLKKSISARKKKLNDDIKAIPHRIDELNNQIKELDFEALDFQRRGIIGGIRDLEDILFKRDIASKDEQQDKNKLNELRTILNKLECAAADEADKPYQIMINSIRQLDFEISSKQKDIVYGEKEIEQIKKDIKTHEEYKKTLYGQWEVENGKQFIFDESKCICPTCRRPLDSDDVEKTRHEMLENFNKAKAEKLLAIRESGQARNEMIKQLNTRLQEINIDKLLVELQEMKVRQNELMKAKQEFTPVLNLESNKEYQDTLKQIKSLEEKLTVYKPQSISDVTDFRINKQKLELELQEIDKQLNQKDQNEKLRIRIVELQEEERALAQQIADIEKQEYLCEEFIKTKVELLESNINNKFKYVNFKLFNTLTNGAVEECCEALINGVPFLNANTASQYNAGIDIINALSDYYQVSAPIFFDNRESVSKLIDTDSQIVNLIKPPTWDELDKSVQKLLAGIDKSQEEYTTEDIAKLEAAKKAWNDRNKTLRIESEVR